jgi:DNA uptake protein ComE-like DNA-binding protein
MLAAILGDAELAARIVELREENGPFLSLGNMAAALEIESKELAEVSKYLTAQSFEQNVSASGEKRVNINTAGRQELMQGLGLTPLGAGRIIAYRESKEEKHFTSPGELLRVPLQKSVVKQLIDKVTISGGDYLSGRINVNTAAPEILAVLPGASSEFVEALMKKRQKEGGALNSLADLLDFPGVSDDNFIAMSEFACTKSSSYQITAQARLRDKPARRVVQGIVLRQAGPTAPVISGWLESSRPVFSTSEERTE